MNLALTSRGAAISVGLLTVAALLLVFGVLASPNTGANRLGDATSPYLLQHAENPVDWYQWDETALEAARQQNKLIFVSVGYSSCFWCHVMAEESFENEAIAEVLNADFISIKIDRETRPDLDVRFSLITQTMTGSAGWPNSVFLTPQGDPIFSGGYFPPQELRTIAERLGKSWTDDPDETARTAAMTTKEIEEISTRSAGAQFLFDPDTAAAARAILPELDEFDGGLGVAPKFPREPVFLFLLDEALRNADRDLLGGVTGMLDGMLAGGVHDHVGGGFHRYSTDPEWHIPHFEKMLYTQALMGRLLIRTWDVTGEPRYRRAAERLFAYVLRDLKAPQGGFYTAQDASSLHADGSREEGAFYMWSDDEISLLGASADLIRTAFQVSPDGDLEGANVLNLAAPLGDLVADAGLSENEFVQEVDAALDLMRANRNPDLAPFTDQKIIASWNAQMIATLAEASFILDNQSYYDAAEMAITYILSDMGGPDDLLRISINEQAEVPAQLADYAALGLAALALHDYAPAPDKAASWLGTAQTVTQAMLSRFQTKNGTFRMVQNEDPRAELVPLDDAMLPSGNAMALALLIEIQNRIEDPRLGISATSLATALSAPALASPVTRSAFLSGLADQWQGSVRRVQFASNGIMRAELRHNHETNVASVQVTLADGWHVNSHQPFQDYLIPTALQIDGVSATQIDYPEAKTKSLRFSETPLALYEGSFVLDAPLPANRDAPVDIVFHFQTCSEDICMLPTQITFVIW